MPRKILALACVVVGLHIIEALTLGTSTLGSFLANGLQIFACGLAVAMAFGACRRGRGLSRPFWLILGAGVALWGVARSEERRVGKEGRGGGGGEEGGGK